MNVNFDGRTYSFEVKPGIEGYRQVREKRRGDGREGRRGRDPLGPALPRFRLRLLFTSPSFFHPAHTPSLPFSLHQFTEAIRRAFSLPEDSELNITFTCDEPATGPAAPPVLGGPGSLLTLQGAGAYDAAVHCASVSAARRLQHGGGVGPASPVAGGGGGGGGGTPLPPLSPASASGRGPAIPPAGGRAPPSPPPGTWTRAPASALSPGRRAPGAERAERGAGGLAAAGPPPADPSASSAEGGARHNRGLLGRRLRDLLNFKN